MPRDALLHKSVICNGLAVPSRGQNKAYDFDVAAPVASVSSQRVSSVAAALHCTCILSHFALVACSARETLISRVTIYLLPTLNCLQLYWQPALQQVQRVLGQEWQVLQHAAFTQLALLCNAR